MKTNSSLVSSGGKRNLEVISSGMDVIVVILAICLSFVFLSCIYRCYLTKGKNQLSLQERNTSIMIFHKCHLNLNLTVMLNVCGTFSIFSQTRKELNRIGISSVKC